MEHTEGPWEAEELLVDGRIITKAGTFEIRTPDYDVATLVPGGGPFRKKADAVLAAAAPGLLGACRAVSAAVARDISLQEELVIAHFTGETDELPFATAVHQMRREIDRAEGR